MNTSTRGAASLWVLIGVVVLVALYLGGTYNSFVKGNEGVDAQWAQVESQYQRRFDLIPNLVESVKGVMEQEQEVFTALADARTRYSGAGTTDEKAVAAAGLDSALSRLLVVMENYPQLRSVEVVQGLMAELSGTENRIAVERQRYNEIVRDYNVAAKTFPRSLIAGLFGFAPRTMFEATEGAATAPQVDLTN
ncbi:MAG: LemA family protein [Candidatus Pacebacteria bacterium]|nr:LemA family protein [Candidatus Paceibacterota bacterium]